MGGDAPYNCQELWNAVSLLINSRCMDSTRDPLDNRTNQVQPPTFQRLKFSAFLVAQEGHSHLMYGPARAMTHKASFFASIEEWLEIIDAAHV